MERLTSKHYANSTRLCLAHQRRRGRLAMQGRGLGKRQLLPGEHLIAYLDGIYLLLTRPRARDAYDVVTNRIFFFVYVTPSQAQYSQSR